MTELEFDVVCVGSGAGGLTAAVSVAGAGGTAIVLEKDEKVGGVTALSGGQIWIGHNPVAAKAGIQDSATEVREYLDFLADGYARPDLRDAFIAGGNEILAYLGDRLGMPFTVIPDLGDYYYPEAPGSKAEGRTLELEPCRGSDLGEWAERTTVPEGLYAYATFIETFEAGRATGMDRYYAIAERHRAADERCKGAAISAHLVRLAVERQVDIRTCIAAQELISGDAGVSGVVARNANGEEVRIKARQGVVLATGGYDWNQNLVRQYEQLTDVRSVAPATVCGDHVTMASKLGAAVAIARPATANPIQFGLPRPGTGASEMIHAGRPHSIIVNRAGARFADEAFYPSQVAEMGHYGGPGKGYANWPAWMVFDQQFRNKYELGAVAAGAEMPEGLAVEASNLRDLATTAGIDPDGLEKGVERFNSFCAAGTDEDFDRGSKLWGRLNAGDSSFPNPNLGPLEEPPFYAVKLVRIQMGIPSAGLAIDASGRVLDADEAPIPGLYAAGNAAAQRDIGAGYNSGIANSRGMIYGYRSAQVMSAVA